MDYKIRKILPLTAALLVSLSLPGCVTKSNSPVATTQRALHKVGRDMQDLGRDLGPPQTTNTDRLGADVQKLGNDLPHLNYELKSLVNYEPEPLTTDLAQLGKDLDAPSGDLTQLGKDIQAKKDTTTDKRNLQSHLPSAMADINQASADMANSAKDPATLATNFVAAHIDIKAFIAHLETLNGDFTAGNDIEKLGPDVRSIGMDISPFRTKRTNQFGDLRIVSGYISLNPYDITTTNVSGVTKEKLKTSNTTGEATLQVDYSHRWAWQDHRDTHHDLQSIFDKSAWENPFNYLDYQMRVGYNFTSSSNASTIIGSGDIDMEVDGGVQLFRKSWPGGAAWSFNLELGVEDVSDRAFDTAHTTLFVGPGLVTSFNTYTSTNLGFLLFRAGAARYDIPAFTTGGYVATNGIGNPKFSNVGGFAFEFEGAYPISSGVYVVANARLYPSHTIAPWSAWVGVSLSGSQITSALKAAGGAFGLSSSSSTSSSATASSD